jgi:MscS family membrane protein
MHAFPRLALLLAAASPARPWIERVLPQPLLREGPRDLLWWQWLALPLVALLAAGAGWLLGLLVRRLLGRVFARTATTWDDRLLERLAGPIAVLCAIGAAALLLAGLGLPAGADRALGRGLLAATYFVFFWAGLRALDLTFLFVAASPWGTAHAVGVSLLPIGRKISKVVLVAIGAIAVLTELGYPVASLLAGLGIGGLALALAAQKTVENLFGSLAISIDQPFRIGDFVRVDEVQGTVESIGLRSTRIRTLDRTLISIPNGKLADMRTETFAARDRLRLACKLSLVYGTTAAQMRAVLEGVEATLRSHPRIWEDDVQVRLAALAESSLDVEVQAWFQTADWKEFLAIRQEMLLRFMEVVERCGTELAFPTRTLRLVHEREASR